MKKITLIAVLVAALFISAVTYKAASSGDTITLYSYKSLRGDAVFSRIVPNNNYGFIEDIHIYAWTQSNTVNVNRVVLDFNTSVIPQNAKLHRAYLNLHFNPRSMFEPGLGGKGNVGSSNFKIEEIVSEWNEKTVTWGTQPDIDAATSVIVDKKLDPRADYLKIDVTDLVQNMINKPADQRFGLRLKLINEDPYNVYFFASGNHGDESLRPSLQIELEK